MFKSSKRLVAMLICLAMVLSMLPMSVFADGAPSTLYLQPATNWLESGARFAAYFFGNGEKWVDCVDAGDGLYSVEVPEGFSKVIFCRMNPGNPSNSWNTKWNQTADLTVPTDGANCYTVKEGTWDKGGGSWSTFSTDCSHEYDDGTVTTAATCTTAGEKTYTCTLCEATKTDSIPATGHTFVDGVCSCGTTSVVIYFDNTGNWENVYVHYWGGGYGTSWPGDAMTLVEGSIYACDVPSDTTSIIFHNNGGTKTDDLTIPTDGKNQYTYSTNVWSVYGEAACTHANTTVVAGKDATCTEAGLTEGSVCADCGAPVVAQEEIAALGHTTAVEGETCERCGLVMDYITVYFENKWMFQDLTAYWWGSSFGTNPEWPGVSMELYTTTEAGYEVYALTVPSDVAGVLFTGTDNDNGSERKTPDITPVANQVYYMNWDEANGEHVLSYDVSVFEPTCEHEYEYDCSTKCKLCGEETRPEAKHEYFYACDAYCMYCYELTNEEAAHSIKHVEAVEATCTATGNIEYWYCEYCNICWDNAEATGMPLNAMSVKTWKDHEYYYACDAYCKDCGELTNPDAAHTITHVEAVEATDCLSWDGNVEYWTCSDCGNCWLDEALTMQTNRFGVVTNGAHSYFTDCDTVCELCGEETRPEASHNVVHVEAVAPSCESEGNVEYWYCDVCGAAWLDEAQTQVTNLKSVILPVTHSVEHVEAKDATCFEEGNIEYWYCTECGAAWTDELLREVTNLKNVVLPVTHSVEHVEAKAATCTENGNVEYWYCTECGAAWTDELLREVTNLKSVITPAAHNYEGNVCTECGDVDIDVKYQTKGDAVRLITYVDDLANYTGVTFTITIGEETAEQTITKAYTSLIANGETKTTEDLFGIDGYLVLLTINSVPAGTEMTVSVTWNCIDGSTVTGDCRIISL